MLKPARHALLSLVVPIVFCAPGVALASITVSPFVLEYEVEPRSLFEEKLTITNTAGMRVTAYPTVNNVSVGKDGGIETFVPASMSDKTISLASWIEISRAGIDLSPGESKDVPLTIRVNPNAAPGSYHALVSFPVGVNRDEAERAVMSGSAPGLHVSASYVEIKRQELSLARFVAAPILATAMPDMVSVMLRNTGEVDVVPRGDIIVYNRRGEEVAAVPINTEGTTIRAGGEGTFRAAFPLDGLLGKYKAYLALSYGSEDIDVLSDTVFFYVFPWKKVALAFGAVLLCAVLISLYIHRRYVGSSENDEDGEGGDALPLHIKDTVSDVQAHDIDMKRFNTP
jgi:hypothetical protein